MGEIYAALGLPEALREIGVGGGGGGEDALGAPGARAHTSRLRASGLTGWVAAAPGKGEPAGLHADEARGIALAWAGDLRNGPELRALLGARGDATTGALLAEAWLRWGRGAWLRVRGPVAAVLAERATGAVYAVRDRLGLVPVAYARTERGARVVSSDAAWVLRAASPGGARPSAQRLGAFLRRNEDDGVDDFFVGLARVRPSESLLLTERSAAHESYWASSARETVAREEVSARVRDAVFDAVRAARDAVEGPVGATMSGGLDSPSVAAVLARVEGSTRAAPLPVGSMVIPSVPECDESEQIDALERALPVRVQRYDFGGDSPLGDPGVFSRNLALGPMQHPGGPHEGAFQSWAERALGVRALFTGIGADQLFRVSRGEYFARLVRTGDWRRLYEERERWGRRFVAKALVEAGATGAGLAEPLVRAKALLDRALPDRRERASRAPWKHGSWLRARADEGGVGEREPRANEQRPLWESVNSFAWESDLRAARARNTDALRMVHPLLDERLWDLRLGVGPEHRMVGGFDKAPLRAAMSGLLPDEIRLRPKLKSFDRHIELGLGVRGAGRVRELFRDPRISAMGLVDRDEFLRCFDAYARAAHARTGDDKTLGSLPIWITVAAELWLRALP